MAYVYRHIRLDKNEPFYIGIGSDKNHNRANEIKKERRNNIWNKIVSKTSFKVDIMIDDLTWGQAIEKEKEFISLYGRIDKGTGILSNLTDGGDGTLGVIVSEEKRKNLSKRMSGCKNPMFGVKHPKELIEQIRLKKLGSIPWNKGVAMQESQKKLLSMVKKGSIAWNKGIPRTADEKVKMSLSHLALKKTPWNKGKKGVNGLGKAKIVLNLENGIFYESCKEASFAYCKKHSTLKGKLNGSCKNDTYLIYA